MPATSLKNLQLSPAGVDLGLGLQTQAEDEIEELRKKKLMASQAGPMNAAYSLLGAQVGGAANGSAS